MLSAFLPMAVGFVKTPIFTRHFSTAEYGELGLVQITYSFMGMILFSWIASCLWRYYPKFNKEKRLPHLYANLFFLSVLGAVLSLVISLAWYLSSASTLMQSIIFYSFFYLVFSQLLQQYMVVVRLEGKARFYTVFQTIRALVGLGLALYLVFYRNKGIESLVSSLALTELLLLLFLILCNPSRLRLSLRNLNKPLLRELMRYGGVGLILNLSMLALTYSDRYVIVLFDGLEAVGIYDQVYKIAQLSVVALTTVFFNTVNPRLLKALEQGKNSSVPLSRSYMKYFLLPGLPVVTYLSIYAREIATLLLGQEFRSAYVLMPFIFLGTFLMGLANFYELRMKFDNSFKKLLLLSLLTAIVNLLLNLVFVSFFNFHWAAYTTLFSYALLLLMANRMEPELSPALRTTDRWLVRAVVLLAVQGLLYYLIVDNYAPGIFYRIAMGVIFVLLYVVLMRRELINAFVKSNNS
jgi:O-antigen/teichoic acid export membrane protein